ncbi:MAG TPA: histidine phosphatase family protein [Thermoanaerobaculia bacterium]|nr:histidine phosphatase family protein [Thermoanaerobaculia bacterium]
MERRRLRLFLLRHGQVAANRDFRFVGDLDEPLTDLGRWQAQRLGEALESLPGGVGRVLASPRRRALDTAHEVSSRVGRVVEVDQRLAEQSFGSWEGLTRQEVQARSPQDAELLAACDREGSATPPDGESFAAVQSRALRLVDELARGEGAVVLVSHVGPIKALLASALEMPLSGARRLFLDPATISVVDWYPSPTLRMFNSHVHLGWSQARWLDAETERSAQAAMANVETRLVGSRSQRA